MRGQKGVTEPAPIGSTELQTSIDFIRQSGGFAVDVLKGQKAPSKGWEPRTNNAATTVQLLAKIAKSGNNLGIHLHSNLVDVDVDSDAVALMEALNILLPPCPHTWGRGERRQTHRVYQLKDGGIFDPSQHLILQRLKTIPEAQVEIRGGPQSRGEYSLLPPSVHPSGDLYAWESPAQARSSPATVEIGHLIRRIRMAGAIAVLAPHWQEGVRQELTLAMAGFLHRAMAITQAIDENAFCMEYDEALYFMTVLWDVAGDDSDDLAVRKRAFMATWKKADDGASVTGATRISEIINDPSVVGKLYSLLTENKGIEAIENFTAKFIIWQGPALVVDLELARLGHPKPLMSKRNFVDSYEHEFVMYNNKRVSLARILWTLESTTRVKGLTLAPGKGLIVTEKDGDKLNQWTGYAIPPFEEPVEDSEVARFTDYVFEAVCDGMQDRYNWVMGWVADIFQRPAEKPGTCLVLVGKPGAGKSILGQEVIGRIIGSVHYGTTNSVENVIRNFNILFANKLLVQCDEAMNSRQRMVAARLKAFITDPYQVVEPKGVDPYHLPSFARLLMTSNEMDDALHIGDGSHDRRYTVLEASPDKCGKLREYWHPFVAWLREPDTLPKIHRWLLDYEYDTYFIRAPLVTAAKHRIQQASWNIFDAWLAAMASRNHPLSDQSHSQWFYALDTANLKPGGEGTTVRHEWPEYISMAALAEDYNAFKRKMAPGAGQAMNEVQLGMLLNRHNLRINAVAKRLTIRYFDGRTSQSIEKRLRMYPPPDLGRIKLYLENKHGFTVDHNVPIESLNIKSNEPPNTVRDDF